MIEKFGTIKKEDICVQKAEGDCSGSVIETRCNQQSGDNAQEENAPHYRLGRWLNQRNVAVVERRSDVGFLNPAAKEIAAHVDGERDAEDYPIGSKRRPVNRCVEE